jgi:hypothetical protein
MICSFKCQADGLIEGSAGACEGGASIIVGVAVNYGAAAAVVH